jgi:hypothetical protein
MDLLYYSNYCKHCAKIKEFFIKSNLTDKIDTVCVDKRKKDSKTGQWVIILDNGKTITLPPNVHSVPSLFLKSNYNVICGDEIIKHFQPQVKIQEKMAVGHLGEPSDFNLMNSSISEKYTSYSDDMTQGTQSFKDSFVSASHNIAPIYAEPDNYKPNKLSADVTIDKLHTYRNEEIQKLNNEDMNIMMQQINQNRHQDALNASAEYTMAPKI